jgi:Cu2+-exporting ATPase
MVWRWAVAALCMMQVMMYATPTYLTQPGEISGEAVHLLRWASWVLSLPVMFFSCTPFFSSAWRDLRERQISMDLPVALGMVVTFVVSTLGTFEPQGPFGGEVFFDSFTMFVFFLLTGRWLELRMRDRTAGALEAVLNRLPDSVRKRQSDGTWALMSIRRLQVGDVIEVLPGEAFAGDGLVLDGQTQVDEALLTGESRPLARSVGDRVIAGSHNLSGTLQVQIEQIGAATRYAQIVALMESASVSKPAAGGPLGQTLFGGGDVGLVGFGNLLVAKRPRARGDGGRRRADRDLSLRFVAGHTCGHARHSRGLGAQRCAGATPERPAKPGPN